MVGGGWEEGIQKRGSKRVKDRKIPEDRSKASARKEPRTMPNIVSEECQVCVVSHGAYKSPLTPSYPFLSGTPSLSPNIGLS